jgi:hypothetical protein
VTQADLEYALAQSIEAQERGFDVDHCLGVLAAANTPPRLPLLIDVLDNDPQRAYPALLAPGHHAPGQPDLRRLFRPAPGRLAARAWLGLYAFWRETLEHDHGIGLLMGLPHIADGIRALPACAREAERWVMRRMDLPRRSGPTTWKRCC